MHFISAVKETVMRVLVYLAFGCIFFPVWFFWNVKEAEFLYAGGYIMHFFGGMGAGLLAAAMVISAGGLKSVTKRFYLIVFPSVFVWLTSMEWTQRSQPWRTFQWEDIWTQTAGLVLALAIVWWHEGKQVSSALLNPAPAE